MDAQGIATLVSSVGFPIVMCLILMKYMEQVQTDNKETIEKMNENHRAETDALKESLNNNTTVLTELKTMLTVLTSQRGSDSNASGN